MSEFLSFLRTVFGTLIGSAMTIVGFIISDKVRRRDEKRKAFLKVVDENKTLFSVIFKGATAERNIDYLALREELAKSNILLTLWGPPRKEFLELYRIHALSPSEYNKYREDIYAILCTIEKTLNKYGEDLFG